jgi:thiol-disulfide isomerase/thioredoxin
MQFNSPNVYYLEDTDFDSQYNLKSHVMNEITGAPFFSGVTIVMVQGDYCGYCTRLKPLYQQIANELSNQGIEFATIQIDGTQPGEQIFQGDALTYILRQPLQGVPLLLKYYQGQPVDQYSGDQSYESLTKWIMN